MRIFFKAEGLVFLLLILFSCVLYLLTSCAKEKEACRRRAMCPRTHNPGALRNLLRLGDKCFEVYTCTGECAASLQKLADASPDAFRDKYESSHENTSDAEPGMHLHNHISKEYAQLAREVSCS
jgi:hypothetical protein